jgi:hypothetical protein
MLLDLVLVSAQSDALRVLTYLSLLFGSNQGYFPVEKIFQSIPNQPRDESVPLDSKVAVFQVVTICLPVLAVHAPLSLYLSLSRTHTNSLAHTAVWGILYLL